MAATRTDGTVAGTTRVATAVMTDNLPIDNPAPNAGTVPATVPAGTWVRTGTPAQAQPASTIERVDGIATFVWLGDDPMVKTPHVTLQMQTNGTFADVTRNSGRPVEDQEIVISYTPSPLQRGTTPQTHVWAVEWQAVPWLGMVGADSLDDRGGVPTGTYRFHVVGSTWSLDSQPFQVVTGGVAIRTYVTWYAPKGWRLMDMAMDSNQPVPVRSQAVTVDLLGSTGNTLSTTPLVTDAMGNVSLPDNASATMVRITDRFGNSATHNVN
jgi:hypothetical protein